MYIIYAGDPPQLRLHQTSQRQKYKGSKGLYSLKTQRYLITDNYTILRWSLYIGGIFLWYPEGTPFIPRPRYTYIIIWKYYIYNIPPASTFPLLHSVFGENSVAFQVFFQGLSLFLYHLPLPDPFYLGKTHSFVGKKPFYLHWGLLNTSQWRTTQLSQLLNAPVEDTQHSIVEVYSTLNLLLRKNPFCWEKTFLSPSWLVAVWYSSLSFLVTIGILGKTHFCLGKNLLGKTPRCFGEKTYKLLINVTFMES